MKIFGTSGHSRHSGAQPARKAESGREKKRKGGRHLSAAERKKRKALKVIGLIVLIIAALVLAAMAVWKATVKPPDVSGSKHTPTPPAASGGDLPSPGGSAPEVTENPDNAQQDGRSGGRYTFALLGTDDGNGNTDTIMIVTFDTSAYTLNLVSIPRDTMVNVKWSTKKVNSLYGVGGVERSMSGLSDILGFDLDFYVLVNLTAFEKLVDAIGGVYYDVPVNMNYSDSAQDLYIDIKKGPQTLSGEDAVKVMRFRSGYASADIGRIGTQQDFMKTAASQIMENKSKLDIGTLADVFLNYVKTDLTYGNIIWFAQEFFKMDMENLTFHTLPGNYGDSVNGNSYVSIYVNDWVKMINEYLNPYDEAVELSDLNILTRDPNTKKIYSTSGTYAGNSSWGNTSSSSKPSASPSPSPSPSPSASPSPDPAVSPSADPAVSPSPGDGTAVSPSPGETAPPDTSAPPEIPDDGGDATTGTEPEDELQAAA